ncbi:MAG: nickel pincer cofactor biosynthesis protein LarC [Oscillospiraceae bacterium]|jgi:uncharacterized protein (TIGR00299 family) protein|nr:nickel pincer cofactor biosynthesis protein LarC [Oscillospiraceae bacterium]
MKTLYLECSMGAAGDMIAASLLGLLDKDDRAAFIRDINALALPGVTVKAEPAVSCGIHGLHWSVIVAGEEEASEDVEPGGHHHHDHDHDGHHHDHDHDHDGHHHDHTHDDHHNHHTHNDLGSISALIDSLSVSKKVKRDAQSVYSLLAEAEASAHGRAVEHVHFHEVGALDAVADIVGACMLMERLAPDTVAASPVQVGDGFVRCAHGVLPVPAPATAHLLRGIPTRAGAARGELCTPTGAALLKHFVSGFGSMPDMTAERVGYGMGRKQFEALNAVRAFIGESGSSGSSVDGPNGAITELRCTVDDMTGEAVGFASELLLKTGALDVTVIPVQVKKNRPGLIISCLCESDRADDMAALLLRHTSTYGVRRWNCDKYMLNRRFETVQTAYGPITMKHGEGYGVSRVKPEFDDCANAARQSGAPIETVMRAAMNAVESGKGIE